MVPKVKPQDPLADGGFDPELGRVAILGQMVVGSIIAGAIIMVPVVFIYVVYLVGTLLPPESKEAADPTPDSFSSYELREERGMDLPARVRWS